MLRNRINSKHAKWIPAILLSLYIGSYYATVEHSDITQAYEVLEEGQPHTVFIAKRIPECAYAIPAAAFAPMHSIDRLLRPCTWEDRRLVFQGNKIIYDSRFDLIR